MTCSIESPIVCDWKTHNSLDKNQTEPQTIWDPIYVYVAAKSK